MRIAILVVLLALTCGCAEQFYTPLEPSAGHISTTGSVPQENIPELVQQVPVLPEPQPPVEQEKYTVVVNEVQVKELLFALARDAKINVDIDPRIDGLVTINAVDQTLTQLLERIARQVDLRYQFVQDNLIISPDEPFIRTYKVGYLNLSRETSGTVTVSTQIASASSGGGEEGGGGGGGGNTSSTQITSKSNHQFWQNLSAGIASILNETGATVDTASNAVVINAESGVVTVRATARQHENVQKFIDQVLESVRRQVMIQATVVEVDLSDQYQAGIDWSVIDLSGAGLSITSTLLGAPGLAGPPITSSSFVLDYFNPNTGGKEISAAVSLLAEFGNTRVLSSPQIMVLNNHTAVLKVVENFVYFEIEQEIEPGNPVIGTTSTLATTTTARTVPVGLVLTVTPQISSDDSVTLNIRPTISTVIRTELDPNPTLTLVENRVPVVRVREMESILKVNSRQIAVLGGLMQDVNRDTDKETPGLSKIPLLGELFKTSNRGSLKTELVIFLRPIVIKNASIEGDLDLYKQYLTAPN
ncbi:MAG: ral secretion pathway protein D [Gammaproteobacteria bacterium]|nr:ral secretion pathway protein D [Gammaproteobacteria bacterium]